MILGIVDIEANYLVVKAYQYTTLTSVQVSTYRIFPFWGNITDSIVFSTLTVGSFYVFSVLLTPS